MNFAETISNHFQWDFPTAPTLVDDVHTEKHNLVLALGDHNYLQIMSYDKGERRLLSLAMDYAKFQYLILSYPAELVEFDFNKKLLNILNDNDVKYIKSDDRTHIQVYLSDIEEINEPQYVRDKFLWHMVIADLPEFDPDSIIAALKGVNYPDLIATSDTERLSTINQRRGQGKFRERLIEYWNSCAVTGFDDPSLLIASHIKPWNSSNNSERLDPYNGLLLSPNLDKAFDLGLITFTSKGKIKISENFTNHETFGIHDGMNIEIEENHKPYLNYHRKSVYQT